MNTNMYDKCITMIDVCIYVFILICAAKVVVKAEPESDDEFNHIKVGKLARRKSKKAPREVEQHYSKSWALIGSIVDSWCTYTHYLRKTKKGISYRCH